MDKQRIVIKVGSSTLTGGTKQISMPQIISLVTQIAHLHDEGHLVILVSSGAVAAGREALHFPDLPGFIPVKQMLSAIGQPRLMAIYTQMFDIYNKTVAQILLTRSDTSHRQRYLNARNTLEALLMRGIIPIVNENDTIATHEIHVGDNDNLSAMVGNLIEADLLILLTDQKGLYTSDPHQDTKAELIPEITGPEIPDWVWKAAGTVSNGVGTGGMLTKLQAADLARRSGTKVVICNGLQADVLHKALNGEAEGTYFAPTVSNLESRKRFILAGPKPAGKLFIDPGATKVIASGCSSLLPVGVTRIEGKFKRGETVKIADNEGKKIAIGIASYDSASMEKLCGHHSVDIEKIIGYTYGNEFVHHDNMILL
ncbi:MAG: glutamate 5-kinase [Anaerolineaceae bacterium]|nr:glutamate 5-kinase [Anaerolineaceae bacterium]